MGIQSCLMQFKRLTITTDAAASSDLLSKKIQATADAALIKIMEAQDNHPYFKQSSLITRQLMALSPIQELQKPPIKDTSANAILRLLPPEHIHHLKTLLQQYPCGGELNLLHFLGMVIIASCQNPDFAKAFKVEFHKLSLACFTKQCLSIRMQPTQMEAYLQSTPPVNSISKTLLRITLPFMLTLRENPEKQDLFKTLSLFNRIINTAIFQRNNLLAEEPLKIFF